MSDLAAPYAPLVTPRLELRRPRTTDAESLSNAMTIAVSQWVASWRSPFTSRMASERILAALEAGEARKAISYVIEHRSSGEFLGWIAISKDRATSRRAMIGYWLAESAHGHGYMREAVPAALASAFSFLDVDVIEAGVQPANASSIAVLEVCGMEHVGERMIFAPSRDREELCLIFELEKGAAVGGDRA